MALHEVLPLECQTLSCLCPNLKRPRDRLRRRPAAQGCARGGCWQGRGAVSQGKRLRVHPNPLLEAWKHLASAPQCPVRRDLRLLGVTPGCARPLAPQGSALVSPNPSANRVVFSPELTQETRRNRGVPCRGAGGDSGWDRTGAAPRKGEQLAALMTDAPLGVTVSLLPAAEHSFYFTCRGKPHWLLFSGAWAEPMQVGMQF